jgi:hypothetical protein
VADFVQIYEMNFFSHYYIDRENDDKWFLFGALLPELVLHFNETLRKPVNNARNQSKYTLHPLHTVFDSIYQGIQRHYQVDKHFHGSAFFKTCTEKIKNDILSNQNLKPLHYRTFYLAHIAFELLIDRILLKTLQTQEPEGFYCFLETLETDTLSEYFTCIEKTDMMPVLRNILNRHLEMKFLFHYHDNEKFVRALMRLYSCVNPSIFEAMPNKHLTALLLTIQEELEVKTVKFVYQFKSSLNPFSAT